MKHVLILKRMGVWWGVPSTILEYTLYGEKKLASSPYLEIRDGANVKRSKGNMSLNFITTKNPVHIQSKITKDLNQD